MDEILEQEQETIENDNLNGNQETDEAVIDQDAIDWTKDNRYKSMWKEDPNQVYKSYREMEKIYNPLKKRVDSFDNTFKEYGIDEKAIADILKEYKGLKSPDAPHNLLQGYMNNWLGNDQYKGKVVDFFKQLEKEEKQQKYGANLPEEIINKLEELQGFKTKYEQEQESKQKEEAYQETLKTVQAQLTEVEKMAEKYGIEFNDKKRDELLTYCHDQDIDPKYIGSVFAQFALEAVKASSATQATRKQVEKLEQNKKAGISVKDTGVSKGTKELSFEDAIREKLGFK